MFYPKFDLGRLFLVTFWVRKRTSMPHMQTPEGFSSNLKVLKITKSHRLLLHS